MSAGERILDAGTGAVKTGIKWGLIGLAVALVACVAVPALLAWGAGFSTAGIILSGVLGGVGGTMGAGIVGGAGYIAATLGALKGTVKGLAGKGRDPEIVQNEQMIHDLNAQVVAEEAKSQTYTAQRERQQARAQSVDGANPEACGNHVEKIQARAAAQAVSAPAAPPIA